ncbi:MAG TPA: hypothetical protein VFU63_08740 [Ktedonobacterales bacterium]|nr:hypothetical protein [Ktedonobacterales bacterium]
MQSGQVQCPQCGWQNQVGDRMCGGCGQPLLQSGAFGTPPDSTPTVASPGAIAPPPLPHDANTATWVAPGYPQPLAVGTSTVVAPPSHVMPPHSPAGRAQPRAMGRSCLGRALTALAIAILLLLVLSACGWAAFVRPALHNAVDQRLRAGLAAEVDKIPVIPVGYPPITRTITDTEFNQQAGTPNNQGDMKDIRIHFLRGEVTMTYLLWGRPGKITAHVATVNGRLFVRNTQVDGWLAQVENGDELQDALNESLARLPAQDYVENVIVGDGTLTVTLRRA